jgi:hypothetical protein
MASLEPVMLKLNWAYKHLERLVPELNRYLESKPCQIVGDFEPYADRHRLTAIVRQRNPVPPEISLMFGDCIHSLRTALDYLVWQLVLAAKNEPAKENMFPVCSEPKYFTDAIKRGRLKGVSEQAAARIKSLQPFNNTKPAADPLSILDELERIDKHRTILFTAVGIAEGGRATFTDHTGTSIETVFSAGYDGAKVATGPFLVHGKKVNMKGEYVTYVALREGAASDMEVTQVLGVLGKHVSLVADQFADFF